MNPVLHVSCPHSSDSTEEHIFEIPSCAMEDPDRLLQKLERNKQVHDFVSFLVHGGVYVVCDKKAVQTAYVALTLQNARLPIARYAHENRENNPPRTLYFYPIRFLAYLRCNLDLQ